MVFKIISSNKAIKYLILALTCIIAMMAIHFIKKIKLNDQAITSRVQSEIISDELKIDLILENFQQIRSDKIIHDSAFFWQEFSVLQKEKFTILIFENDSLIYWSNNKVPIYDNYNTNQFEAGLNFLVNGYYDVRQVNMDSILLVGLVPIKHEYTYENQFLKNEFAGSFNIPDNVKLSRIKDEFAIFNTEGEFLFSLVFPERFSYNDTQLFLLTLLYFLAYILIISATYHGYKLLFPNSKFELFRTLGFIFDVLILRALTFYFRYPNAIFDSPFFSPEFYASSLWAPSLGDLFLHAITAFSVAMAVHEGLKNILSRFNARRINRYLFMIISLILVFGLFRITTISIESLVFNSGISFNLTDISGIDLYSIIGFTCIGLMILTFVFLTYRLLVITFSFSESKAVDLAVIIIFTVLFFGICRLVIGCAGYNLLFLLLYLLVFLWIRKHNPFTFSISNSLVIILLFAVFSTFILYQSNFKREREIRKILATNLSEQRDPIAEYKFTESVSEILKDDNLNDLIHNYPFPEIDQLETTTDYIIRNYFSNYWSKYDVLVTICDTARILNLRPDDITVNCNYYFEDLIQSYGHETNCEDFYFIDLELNDDYYLGRIRYPFQEDTLNIYVEFYSKSVPKGLGYPELLKDYEKENEINWSVYSFARYENKELFFRLGKYFYSMNLENYAADLSKPTFFNLNGYNHYYYPIDQDAALIISIKNPGFLEISAPFSYISIFYGLLVYLVYLLFKGRIDFKLSKLGFRQRLQLTITLLIIASFFLVGVGSSLFIISLNNNKNHSILSEKAHSVLVEMEHKLAEEESLPPEMETYLSDLLYKFSMVFFTDINLYDVNGTLLATSRAEIFNRGLISTKMNAEAFRNLHNVKKSLYIHKEAIGDYPFLSAYLPLRNYDNKLIAYINLPYFAKQDELTNEISTFLVGFINVYVILIAIAIYMALFVSNYISKPLQLLKGKLRNLKLGETEQKIVWKKDDEIGSLVEEYNRMVDELAKSAELLAKSERESAWREMAKQIAHEIKNPLTPMKLSVQYLEKAWNEKLPDWDERLHRFTETIIEQIDSLSVIASAFSDFANMPKSRFTKIELTEVIRNAIGLFKDTTTADFKLIFDKEHYILGDKEQFLRVFNNLIKNALQAIDDPDQGQISIALLYNENEDQHLVRFSDNGSGIPEEQRDKVFYPNFTTKSGGTGLGLALVKNIIMNAGGSIEFESSNKGTTFIITLPGYTEPGQNNGSNNDEATFKS